MYRKLLSLLLAVCMVVSLVPAALAADGDVAYIGETGYATLDAAVAAADNEDVIIVTQDVKLTSELTIPAGLTVTLDLNGKTVSMEDSSSAACYMIRNEGNLTIMDGSADQTGKITFCSSTPSSSYSYSTSTIGNAGVLTVESGTIESTTSGGASYAIDNYWYTQDVSLTINDGTIAAKGIAVRQVPFSTTYKNVTTVNGGSLTGGSAGLQVYNYGNTANLSEVYVYGGTFTGTYAFYTTFSYANTATATTIEVAGGTFDGYLFLYNGKAGSSEYPFNVSITDGTFNSGVYTYTKDSSGNDVAIQSVSGGTFAEDPSDYLVPGVATTADEDGIYSITPATGSVAAINSVGYPTLADAIAAADYGQTITLLTDIQLDSLLRVENNTNMFTIEGNGYTISGAGLRFVNCAEVWLSNIVFENCTSGNYGIVEFEAGSSGWINECEFRNNTCGDIIDVGSDAAAGDVKITDCIFADNTCATDNGSNEISVINHTAAEYLMVASCDFIDNSAEIAVIYMADDACVMNNYFSGNTLTAVHPETKTDNRAAVLAGPWESGSYEIQIVSNAFLDTAYPGAWLEDWSADYSAVTAYDLCDNYWFDGSEPVKGADYGVSGTPEICCDTYANTYTRNSDGSGVSTLYNSFTDVKAGSFYEDAVIWAVENGITKGMTDTTFCPDLNCTRAQVVTFIWRANGQPEPESTDCPFTDVNPNAFYYDAMLWAVENGITKGTTDTTFSPDKVCTRAEAVTFIWRGSGKPEADSTNCPFTDVNAKAFYYNAMLWAVEDGITKGMTATTFCPDLNCVRSQIVTFIYRAEGM